MLPEQINHQQGIPGVNASGVFWYWNDDVTRQGIAERKSRERMRAIVTALMGVLGIGSLLVFGLSAFLNDASALLTERFWVYPNSTVVFFLFGIFAFLIVWYRVKSSAGRVKLIPKQTATPSDVTVLPSLEMAPEQAQIETVFSKEARESVDRGFAFAADGHHADVSALHLFLGALTADSVQMLLMRLAISFDRMKDPIRRHMAEASQGQTQFGLAARTVLARAFRNAVAERRNQVGSVEIFLAAYQSEPFLEELFASLEVEKEELLNAVAWMRINEQINERISSFREAASFKPTSNMDRAYTAAATPFLDSISEDLTKLAVFGRLPMLIGRDREMDALLRSIEGGRQSVVLVGDPGTGKDTIVSGLAQRMVEERVPKELEDKRLVRISIPHLVGSEADGGAQERLLALMSEVARAGNVILVFENIEQLVGGGGVDLSAVLASELEKHYTFVIASTSTTNYPILEKSPLAQALQKIPVEEPERNEAIQIVESKIGGIENKNKVIFTYDAVAAVVDLSIRYLHDSFLPVKAIQLADEVGLVVGKRGKEWAQVTKEDVAALVSEKARVNVTAVTKKEGAELLNLEERLHERIVGQNEAVKAISAALRRSRTELRATNRPIANFLFLGPTGVGKTELAKVTSEVFFGSEDAMIRIDMSEYQDASASQKLIGGAGEVGILTEAVRKNPFSLVLLDEFEKAHPDILNLFLQVMDDGRLTDGTGRTVDMTNVILVATSNAGTQYIQDAVVAKTPYEAIRAHLLEEELKSIYKPELLNRFDGVMVFTPLSEDEVVQITYLMLKTVTARLEAKGIHLRPTDEAVYELAKLGYDPKFGARPLRRVIQERVDDKIAEFLLRGDVARRDTLILKPQGVVEIEKAVAL